MRHLEREGVGFDTGSARVPIVPTAILYDLGIGSSTRRPDAAMGMKACRAAVAGAGHPVASGSVGAGTGATVGKLFGMARAMKGGIGNAALRLPSSAGGATVAALAAVNAFGDVIDYDSGAIVAGARAPLKGGGGLFAGTEILMRAGEARRRPASAPAQANTTLVVVATDAKLSRVEARRLGRVCQDGIARSISPAHTSYDGDIVFALSAGNRSADLDCLGVTACRAVGMAVFDAVASATTLGGVPALRDLRRGARDGQPRK
jgi:L-aminopeptidase/D-esterase-like protein